MRTVFLDVGGHEGQTLDEVTKATYLFDLIYSFEPMPREFNRLVARFGSHPKVRLKNFGLADRTGRRNLYGSNDHMEASIHPTKVDADASVITDCLFLEASDVFRFYLNVSDVVVMKLNCEGAEVEILNNLIDTGFIRRVNNVMIDFDIRKVTGLADQESNLVGRLWEIGFNDYVLSEDVMVGETHQDRIAHWLKTLDFLTIGSE